MSYLEWFKSLLNVVWLVGWLVGWLVSQQENTKTTGPHYRFMWIQIQGWFREFFSLAVTLKNKVFSLISQRIMPGS